VLLTKPRTRKLNPNQTQGGDNSVKPQTFWESVSKSTNGREIKKSTTTKEGKGKAFE